jgi:hypothetical protein
MHSGYEQQKRKGYVSAEDGVEVRVSTLLMEGKGCGGAWHHGFLGGSAVSNREPLEEVLWL